MIASSSKLAKRHSNTLERMQRLRKSGQIDRSQTRSFTTMAQQYIQLCKALRLLDQIHWCRKNRQIKCCIGNWWQCHKTGGENNAMEGKTEGKPLWQLVSWLYDHYHARLPLWQDAFTKVNSQSVFCNKQCLLCNSLLLAHPSYNLLMISDDHDWISIYSHNTSRKPSVLKANDANEQLQ